MITDYIQAAMRQAHYSILDDGTFFGEIPGFQGVWANDDSLELCREELQSVLEGWILLGLRMGHSFPTVDGRRLEVELEPA
ncbi:MAG: type II toxin-antitoxin system HicB family antitoxin [Anaerolineae bacterium]